MINITTKYYSDMACTYYCQGKNREFVNSMTNFYHTGKQNPAVAKFHLFSSIRETVDAFKRMSSGAVDIAKDIKIEPEASTSIEKLNASFAIKKAAIENAEGILAHALGKTIGLFDVLNGSNTDLNNLPEKIAFDQEYDRLYPRTRKIREQLLKNMQMDKITPKTSWLSKIMIAHTIDEYKKLYPKTFKKRFLLLKNNRIKEGVVTPKLTNVFKKIKYLIRERLS